MIGVEDERVHAAAGEGFADAVTFAWGDPRTGVCGTIRVGLVAGPPAVTSTFALIFAGREPVLVHAHNEPRADGADWPALEAEAVQMRTDEPLAAWRVTLDAGDAVADLRFAATSPPLELGADAPAARAGGMVGYEQVCRVQGTVEVGGTRHELDCLGQRGHLWGAADWRSIALARTVSAWWDDGAAFALTSVRDARAGGQEGEAASAYLLGAGGPLGDDGAPLPIDEARVSTTYDGEGRQLRAGLELWPEPDSDLPARVSGELLCGTTLDLGELRLDSTFFSWRLHGRPGIGRYDVLRRA